MRFPKNNHSVTLTYKNTRLLETGEIKSQNINSKYCGFIKNMDVYKFVHFGVDH